MFTKMITTYFSIHLAQNSTDYCIQCCHSVVME